MKLKIGQYLVTVSAELDPEEFGAVALFAPKEPDEHTKDFLNEIACAMVDATAWNNSKGFPSTAAMYREQKSQIYKALAETGYYDGVLSKSGKERA